MSKSKIEIINVTEINNGISDSPSSFVIDTKNKKTRNKLIESAEELFISLAKEHGMEDNEKESVLDNGSFENRNGYEVILNWSTVMN